MHTNKQDPKRWAIVGGGMLGLTMAHRMSREGHDVTVIEAAPELGGLVSVWQLGHATWDKHYHVILLSDSRLRNLLAEIGLEHELNWAETRTGFYTNEKLYSMSDTREFLNFPPLNLIEKLRLGGTIFLASRIRNWKRLERIKVAKWLQRWSGKGTFNKIWLPLLRAKLGDAYEETAASFIWAHINRMYKARRTGLKKEMFGYVRGGYRTIVNRLAECLDQQGAATLVNHRIREIEKLPSGKFEIRFEGQPAEAFDRVIMTTPAPVIKRSCQQLSQSELDKLASIKYLGIINASMLLTKSLSPYYVTNITDSWVPMTAVIEMTNIVAPAELGGSSLVYLPKYVPAEHPLFEKSDDEIREDFLSAIERMYPEFSRDHVQAFQIARVRNVMAIPTINYSNNLPDQTSTVPGLFLVNSAYITKGNLNVNETIQIGEDAIAGPLHKELQKLQAGSTHTPTQSLAEAGV